MKAMNTLDDFDARSAVTALGMICDNEHGESYSAGLAMSALATIEERHALGECYWHPGQSFTMEMKLCNDEGIVPAEQKGEFVGWGCTGGAHRHGFHIKCSSPFHKKRT